MCRGRVEYHRLLREESPLPAGSMVFATAAHAAAFLARCSGNVLLATGAKELAAFAALGPERLFPRVLPTREALPPARPPVSRTETSLPCRGHSAMR